MATLPSFDAKRFQEVSFFRCCRLTSLESLGELHTLKTLNLWTCQALTQLPCSLSRLQSLEKICISECHALRSIPECIGELCSLWYVQIKRCDCLTSLPDSLGRLQKLWMLHIESCAALTQLPASICNARSLEHVLVKGCNAMVFPPANVTCLQTRAILNYCQRQYRLPQLLLLILCARRSGPQAHLPDEMWSDSYTTYS